MIDPRKSTLKAISNNLTYSDLLSVEETIIYREDPANPDQTLFNQEARITALNGVSRFSTCVEDFCMKRFGDNAKTGRNAFESVLDRLHCTVSSSSSSESTDTLAAM